MQWVMAATLICGASVFTSCSDNDDNPVNPTTPTAELLYQWITDYEEEDTEGDGMTADHGVKVYEFFDDGTGYYERYLLNNGELEYVEYCRGENGDFTYTVSGNQVTITLLDEFNELEPTWTLDFTDGLLIDPDGRVYRHSTEAEREQIFEWYVAWHGGNAEDDENKDNVVTLTATVSLDGGAGTSAIDGTTGAKTFETGKQIAVIYKDGDNKTKKAVSTDFTPLADATKATFTVTLSNPANNSAIRYIYPATMAKEVAEDATIADDDATIDYSGIYGSQDGTLATLANYDLAVKDAALSGTDQPVSVTLTNPLAICKFTFKDVGSNDITGITRLTVSNGTNAYAVSTSGLSEIYVAMKPVASGNIAFTAATASKTYFRTVTGKSLVASKLYTNITVGSMVELAKGNVIGYDGNIYASKTAAGSNAAAVIVYLGSDTKDATFKNGLAIALDDEGSMNWSTAKSTCDGKTPTVTGAKWCLPSRDQWNQMFKANGGDEGRYTGLNTTITTAGGTTLRDGYYDYYWSSSEHNPGKTAYEVHLTIGYVAEWVYGTLNGGPLVRACLAF
jgi:hypothetical protein